MRKRTLLWFLAVIVLLILIVIAFLISQKRTRGDKLEHITIQAGWLFNGEFANVCNAMVNNYYRDEGLDVTLNPGGPSGASFIVATTAVAQYPNITAGIDGDLVPLLRGVTKEREAERYQVKAFASFWNENPLGFIVPADSGLSSLKDFANKKADGSKYRIGITADSVIQDAIAQYIGVPVSQLNLVTVGFDPTPLLTHQVDALVAYWTTQAYEFEKAGFAYRFLSASELPGWNQPSMIAVASNTTIKNNPETLKKWLQATIKGSQSVIDDPHQAAVNMVSSQCGGPALDVTQEEWLIRKSVSLFDKNKIGWLPENKLENFAQAYFDLKQIPRKPGLNEFADYSILNAIYH